MYCTKFKRSLHFLALPGPKFVITLGVVNIAVLFAADNPSPTAPPETKNKSIVVLEQKKGSDVPNAAQSATTNGSTAAPKESKFEELKFNRTLIIEGKVEKPQVQFTILKEAPPEKEIHFETSFLQNILKLDRENNFKVGETYGRE